MTGDDRKIAIENQYGVADRDHLTRGLAYAVAVAARGLVVVAEHHRDEFVSVAVYRGKTRRRGEEEESAPEPDPDEDR